LTTGLACGIKRLGVLFAAWRGRRSLYENAPLYPECLQLGSDPTKHRRETDRCACLSTKEAEMRMRLTVLGTALLVVVLVLVAVSAFAQDEPAADEVVVREKTENALAQTRPWSSVGAACQPDDDAPYTRYETLVSSGYVEFKTNITGDNYFVCNVTTPIDSYPNEPDWNYMYLTMKDPDAYGYTQACLYRKNLSTGAVGSMGCVTSTDGTSVHEVSVGVGGFDFDTYAYFVRIRMNRSNTSSDQEFHIVRLQFILVE
jgi:hypothetical protein